MKHARRLSLAGSFARSWLSWFVGGCPRPISASFCITHRCNLRCSYCNSPLLDVPELGLDDIAKVLDALVAAGVRRLGITGGEPLLRPDLPAIVRAARQRNLVVMLNSNLTLYHRQPEALAEVDFVMTSLDGDAAAHCGNRGQDADRGVEAAIRALVARGKPVIAIAVVTERNVAQLDELLDRAESLGIQLHLQPRIDQGVCARGSRSDALAASREREFWTRVLERRRQGRPIASSELYLEALSRWECFDVPALLDESTRCAAGHGFLWVDPNGEAYPCIYLKGNVEPINLLQSGWHTGCKNTTCSRCIIGPHLEFNTLYQHPLRAGLSAARTYA